MSSNKTEPSAKCSTCRTSNRDVPSTERGTPVVPGCFPAARASHVARKKDGCASTNLSSELSDSVRSAGLSSSRRRPSVQELSQELRANRKARGGVEAASAVHGVSTSCSRRRNSDTDMSITVEPFSEADLDAASTSSPVLLHARVVEEPTLVRAVPMPTATPVNGIEDLENPAFAKGRDETTDLKRKAILALNRKRLACGAVALVIFLLASSTIGLLVTKAPDGPVEDLFDDPKTGPNLTDVAFLPEYTLKAIQDDPSSAQGQALHWIQNHPKYPEFPTWRKRHMMGLVTLFMATDWHRWRPDTLTLSYDLHECEWLHEGLGVGYRCNETYNILIVEDQGLKGTLPPEIGLLTDLHRLALGDNQMSGQVPTQIGLLTSLLDIDLSDNQFTSTIPTQLGQLTALQYLDFGENLLDGSIPSETGSLENLDYLSLHYNRLSGFMPSELARLSLLQGLWLNENALTSSIPTQVGRLTQLREFVGWTNFLTGPLPTQLGALTFLSALDLNSNRLSGIVPGQLSNLPELVGLGLHGNQISGIDPALFHRHLPAFVYLNLASNRIRELPTEMGRLESLEYLDLGSNDIEGPLPSEIGSMTALTSLQLDENMFSSMLPTEFGDLLKLSYLTLSDNGFTGNLPSELSLLTALRVLNFNANEFSGTLPSLEMAKELGWMGFSANSLTGSIPFAFCNRTNIHNLGVDCNELACECWTCQCNDELDHVHVMDDSMNETSLELTSMQDHLN